MFLSQTIVRKVHKYTTKEKKEKILITILGGVAGIFTISMFYGFVELYNAPNSIKENHRYTYIAAESQHYVLNRKEHNGVRFWCNDGDYQDTIYEKYDTIEEAQKVVEDKTELVKQRMVDSTGVIHYFDKNTTEEQAIRNLRKWIKYWVFAEVIIVIIYIALEVYLRKYSVRKN